MAKKNWVCSNIPGDEIKRLSAEAGIPELLSAILINRGISDAGLAKKFLHPSIEDLHDPFMLKDMDKAVERIVIAVESKENITIYGDYDVDGVSSTSMLYRFLKDIGTDALYYIPDRLEEGYGLSTSAMDKIAETGTQLIITVDCGITAVDEISHANSLGMQVVVTDHHECREILPEAYAVVNPCRSDCKYPFKELAGAGVVFKLIQALCLRLSKGTLFHNYLDFAALATIADVVPLVGENRIIAKFGLKAIENSENPGIAALIDVASLKGKPINTYGVGFGIAPRINAAGRLGDAERAVRLFTTADCDEAIAIAQKLDCENKYRQDVEAEILKQAIQIVETDIDIENEKVIVVAGEGWHHGIIGIVASKITERYYRPSILISIEDGIGKGSGRSIEGFNLFKALVGCESLLERFGGHEMAAGLSLNAENLPLFRRTINEYANREIKEEDLVPKIRIDAFIKPEDINLENAEELELLAPFGVGNPGPVLAQNNLKVEDVRTVGDGKHLKLKLGSRANSFDAIGFNMGDSASDISSSGSLSAVFSMEINVWNSSRKVQLNLKDLKPGEQDGNSMSNEQEYYLNLDKNIVFSDANEYNIDIGVLKSLCHGNVQELIPERQDVGAVYQHIRSNCAGKLESDDLFVLAKLISEKYRLSVNYFKLSKSLQILKEIGLLEAVWVGEKGIRIELLGDGREKTSLERSPLYRKLQELKSI